MNLEEMKRRFNEIATRMGVLAKQDKLTDDEDSELDKLLNEFNALGPKIERLESAKRETERLSKSAGRTAGSEADALNGKDGDGKGEKKNVDRRTIGEKFAASDQLKSYLENGTEKQRFGIGSLNKAQSQIAYGAGPGPSEQYDIVATGNPVYLVPPMVVPGIFRPRDYALTMRQVLSTGRTTSDTIYFLRELLFTNNAAETAQASATGGSSGTKPESALTFEQASAPVVTIAHWIPITRQALSDAAQLQSYIENRLLVGLERRANSQLIVGAGGGTNLTGILNTAGIQVADNTYFAGAPTKNAGTDNENFERVMRAQTLVRIVGRGLATFVTLHPTDVEQYMTTTDSVRQYMGGGPFSTSGVRTLWGLPIAVDEGITAGTALVGDGTMATIWDREDANILIDTINDQFVRNMLTILAEERLALTVYRPATFVQVTLASWS